MNWIKVISIFSALLLSVPVLYILVEGFAIRSPQAFSSSFLEGVELSLLSSVTAAVIDVIVFTPLAYYLSRGRDPVVDTLADVPASIPHPIVGVALVFLDASYSPVGRFLQSLGINFFDTFQGLVAALVIVSAPIYVRGMRSYFDALPRSYENYAMSLGAGPLRTFAYVVLPESLRGVVLSALTSMSRALSEFGSIAIIAYYVLGQPFNGVSPASIQIYNYYGYYGPQVAISASAVMILAGLVLLVVIKILGLRLR
ncbi:ABC transporter permease [Metallosphaera javensis (ex Sakai et al. 2022)]|uniref:ABC transporter permease n=1 Tax=Metallosphaera javensis (ex Sakai et al. 2022) TaxID=2775498 RepID=UPI00258FE1E2|nr:MAG: molybdate/tungstate transport system permease protein WtpB [Metallosphaera javensis (ex Sakai et al. 2022)]